MVDTALAYSYLGEVAERTIRFGLHVDAVESEFFRADVERGRGTSRPERPVFVDRFKQALDELVETIRTLHAKVESADEEGLADVMMLAREGMVLLGKLHQDGLLHLPRPSEPVELRRFLRMISKHVLFRERPDLAVYVTEETSETAFATDPLHKLLRNAVELRVRAQSSGDTTVGEFSEYASGGGIHLTIARIDARNPLRWPSLLHEAAHRLVSKDLVGEGGLEARFDEWLSPELRATIEREGLELSSWLTEVWCDLFAALVMGPAFYFGQFEAFITAPPIDPTARLAHPPHSVRLRLVRDYLRHRHPELCSSGPLRASMNSSLRLVEYWDRYVNLDVGSNASMKCGYDCLRAFFQDHFFAGPGAKGDELQRKYDKMVRYVREIDSQQLNATQASLAEGLPAPSKPHRDAIPFAEEPTSVQEVLLAAWLDRVVRLREKCLAAIGSGTQLRVGEPATASLQDVVHRFDDAVLRSLQLAEWLHVLAPNPATAPSEDLTKRDTESRDGRRAVSEGLLNDREIAALISDGSLKVVPLVDIEQQLGTTSLDIRLGTSFEVYLPAYRRGIEAGDAIVAPYDSGPIDLDFLEYVVLLPGQIVLAHSFEYIRLPDNIAADLEGRSSYARLGLQVHLTAGMIDPGFEGVITLELVNNGPNPIKLYPGVRIAQLRMQRVSPPTRPYSIRHLAKYHGLLHHRTSLYMTDGDYKRIDAERTLAQTDAFGRDGRVRVIGDDR